MNTNQWVKYLVCLICWAGFFGNDLVQATAPQTVRLQAYNLEPSLQPDPNQSERERVSKKRARAWAKKVQKRLPKAKSRPQDIYIDEILPTLGVLIAIGLLIFGVVGLIIGLKAGNLLMALLAVVGHVVGLIGLALLIALNIAGNGLVVAGETLATFALAMLYAIIYFVFALIMGLSYGVVSVWLIALLPILGIILAIGFSG